MIPGHAFLHVPRSRAPCSIRSSTASVIVPCFSPRGLQLRPYVFARAPPRGQRIPQWEKASMSQPAIAHELR